MPWFLALMSLAFLIIVHEGGHFFVARWCKMRVDRFSIGFGPGILKKKTKSGTVFQLAPIPFGGFVEIRGMNIAEDVDPDDKLAYPNRPAWQRFLTIFAGPATNYLSAVLIVFMLYNCHGQESSWKFYGVAAVKEDYDAFGKLKVGDRILAVDGDPILAAGEYVGPDGTRLHSDDLGLVGRVSAKKGAPVTLTILRDGHKQEVLVQPKLVFRDIPYDMEPKYLLGIAPSNSSDTIDIGVVASARESLIYPVVLTQRIGTFLYEVVRGRQEADPGGPKRIVDEFKSAWELGWVTGLQLLAGLSVYLGLFNLLPLPALDGGRLVFLTYELVTRRRANPKIEATVHMAGIMVLAVVMILVTLRDFKVFS
ncbi:MAG TPA: M50 family metallopeptidase [Kofleriaceae bacterium]|nr:M50 family metallopeptidase [Kofleriaceae bacterium]